MSPKKMKGLGIPHFFISLPDTQTSSEMGKDHNGSSLGWQLSPTPQVGERREYSCAFLCLSTE